MDTPTGGVTRRPRWLGAVLGGAAGLLLVNAIIYVRLTTGTVSLPEVVADGLLLALPGALASTLIDTLGKSAKLLLYAGMIVGIIGVGAALGAWYAGRPGWRRAATIGLGAWLLFGGVVYPLVGAGLFGAGLRAGASWHAPSLLALFGLYAVALQVAFTSLAPREALADGGSARASRRLALQNVAAGLATLVGGTLVLRFLRPEEELGVEPISTSQPARRTDLSHLNEPPFDVAGLSPEVTPTEDFYTVSKNLFDPVVSARGWKLRIDGLVGRPLELTYEQLIALPASEGFYTLMCISNEVGGDLWGNAHWRGVKVRGLLEQAGVRADAARAIFTAADDYRDSVRLDRLMHPDTLLAWEMNGRPLTNAHGFPARLLLPGIYGMENIKWLTGITISNEDLRGYWQQRGWDAEPFYRTASRVDVPRMRASLMAGEADVAGVAFAGDRGIRRVEVSLDGGGTWTEATVKNPLSPYTWVLWRASVRVTLETRDVRVRATDGNGGVQTRVEAPPFPSGSSGWHTVNVSVT